MQNELAAAMVGCGPQAAAVVLDRLFAADIAMPSPSGLAEMLEQIKGYPAWAIERGVVALIRSHRWPSPPKIADLLVAIQADPDWRALSDARARVRTAALRLKLCGS